MSSAADDDAWRAIVENYGERPTLPDGDLDEAEPEPPTPYAAPDAATAPAPPPAPAREPEHEHEPEPRPDARYVPPPPPPLPVPAPRRAVAWGGVFGAPALLLVLLVAGVSLPPWASYVLVAWFVGGFLYLVLQMPSGPGDPWDDGARV